jgi:ADP-dependent phosphofructokinase/glucokinase
MFTDQAHYETLLDTICDEINVKEIHLESPQIPSVHVIYNVNDGFRVEFEGNVVDAPKTTEIIVKAFFSAKA